MPFTVDAGNEMRLLLESSGGLALGGAVGVSGICCPHG